MAKADTRPQEDEAFNFGRGFSSLVKTYRGERRSAKVPFSVLVSRIQEYTKVSPDAAKKLASRVLSSDKNMTALCLARRLLSVQELEQMAVAKNMSDFVYSLEG